MSTHSTNNQSGKHNIILVTAATAPVGRSIVEQLVAMGHPVRALTRDPEKAGLPAEAEVVAGDLSDAESLAAAFQDVSAVFLLAVVPGFVPPFSRQRRRQECAALCSSHREQSLMAPRNSPIPSRPSIMTSNGKFEILVWSGPSCGWRWPPPMRCNGPSMCLRRLKDGDVVRGPYAEATGSPIHPADFAAVAIVALTQDEHAGKIYHLTGPASLTHREQVQLIGEALGRSLRYEELDEEQARAAISPYAPADVLFETWKKYTGTPAPVTDTVQELTGRPPHSVEAWAADIAAHLQ